MNEKDIGKTQYSNIETQIEIIYWKNDIYINKNCRNQKYIFANNFKYVKGKILYYLYKSNNFNNNYYLFNEFFLYRINNSWSWNK